MEGNSEEKVDVKKEKKRFKLKKISVNKKVRLVSMVGISILLIISSFMLYNVNKKGKYVEKKASVYSYNNRARVNYQVFLLPNNLYPQDQKSLGEGNVYIRKITDFIETSLKYDFSGDLPAEISGQYSAKAVIEGQLGEGQSKKTIWKKEEVIQAPQSFNVSSGNHSLELKSRIKPQYFEQIASTKAKESDLSFQTKLTIYWNVQVEAKTAKGTVNEVLSPTMEIPISTEKFFEIKGNLTPEKKGTIEAASKILAPNYNRKVMLYIAMVSVCFIALLVLFIFTASRPVDSIVRQKLKKIFKNHGDRLVRLVDENLINLPQLIFVKEFEDLLRIADDIGRPIFYKEKIEQTSSTSFYLFDEKYVYILRLEENSEEGLHIDKHTVSGSNQGVLSQ